METTAYKTGRLGLSTPEIEAEMEEIRQAVIKRDPEATRHGLAYFYLHTPQENFRAPHALRGRRVRHGRPQPGLGGIRTRRRMVT